MTKLTSYDFFGREDGGRRGYDPETYSRLVWALEDADRSSSSYLRFFKK